MNEVNENKIPYYYRVSRLLVLIFCLPTALVMTFGTIIQHPNYFFKTIQNKEINHYTIRHTEYKSYRLKTENQYINVSLEFYENAGIGDSLRLKRGITDFTNLVGYNSIELIRNNRVIIKESEHPVYSIYPYVLLLIYPLVSFLKYDRWKDNIYVKVPLVMIPLSTILMLLITWLIT